jgi:hypothetical protein
VQGLRSPKDGSKSLDRNAHDIVVRLLRGKRAAGSLRVETENSRSRVRTPEPLRHHLVPDLTRGTVLCDLFEEIVVSVKKEREPRSESIDMQPRPAGPFHILNTIVERECQFLQGCRAGFANVVTTDGNRIPLRNVFRSELQSIHNKLHRRPGRKDEGLFCDVFLEDIVLNGAAETFPRYSLLFCHRQIHGPENRRGSIRCHGRADLVEWNTVEEQFHIGQRINRDSALADFSGRHEMIGVETH